MWNLDGDRGGGGGKKHGKRFCSNAPPSITTAHKLYGLLLLLYCLVRVPV